MFFMEIKGRFISYRFWVSGLLLGAGFDVGLDDGEEGGVFTAGAFVSLAAGFVCSFAAGLAGETGEVEAAAGVDRFW